MSSFSGDKMKKAKTADIAHVSLCTAMMCVCSWIQLPSAVPFTLQTFAVFFTAMSFGTKKGLIATIVYILLGAVGVPVFSGFQGGISALAGATGGFIIGFIPAVIIVGLCSRKFGAGILPSVLYCVLALTVCYVSGVLWYAFVYGGGNLQSAFYACVLPFIIPDAAKILLAATVSKRIKKMKIIN